MGSLKRHDDRVYQEGVRDGQRANGLDRIVHAQTKGFTLPGNQRDNDIYNAGYEYGVAHKPRAKPTNSTPRRADRDPEDVSQQRSRSASSSESDPFEGFATLCGFIGAVVGFVHGWQVGGLKFALLDGFFGFIVGAFASVVIVLIIGISVVAITIYCLVKLLTWLF